MADYTHHLKERLLKTLRRLKGEDPNEFDPNGISHGKTSFAESYTGYLKICSAAVKSTTVFQNFKRDEDYRYILEHVTQEEGSQYLNIIEKEGRWLLSYLPKFKTNDAVGNPYTYSYDIGTFSPTTLRYIKVLSDLKKNFGSLDNMNIIEIGAGYGGQCKIIHDVFNPKKYEIVDLDIVLQLNKKYLKKFGLKKVTFTKFKKIKLTSEWDMVISNYAFAECKRSIQDIYIKKVLSKAKRGYITYNYNTLPTRKSPYNNQEIITLLSQFHTLKVMKENPLTKKGNIIIMWDDSKI